MQVIAGIKRKASFVWGMEAESSASAVQIMKLVWELLMMGKKFFPVLLHSFSATMQPLYMKALYASRRDQTPSIQAYKAGYVPASHTPFAMVSCSVVIT